MGDIPPPPPPVVITHIARSRGKYLRIPSCLHQTPLYALQTDDRKYYTALYLGHIAYELPVAIWRQLGNSSSSSDRCAANSDDDDDVGIEIG